MFRNLEHKKKRIFKNIIKSFETHHFSLKLYIQIVGVTNLKRKFYFMMQNIDVFKILTIGRWTFWRFIFQPGVARLCLVRDAPSPFRAVASWEILVGAFFFFFFFFLWYWNEKEIHQKGASPKGLGWPLHREKKRRFYMGWVGVEGVCGCGT